MNQPRSLGQPWDGSEGVADTSDGDRRGLQRAWKFTGLQGGVGGIGLGFGRDELRGRSRKSVSGKRTEQRWKGGGGGRCCCCFGFGDGDWQRNWASDSSDWAHWECWPRARESGHISILLLTPERNMEFHLCCLPATRSLQLPSPGNAAAAAAAPGWAGK